MKKEVIIIVIQYLSLAFSISLISYGIAYDVNWSLIVGNFLCLVFVFFVSINKIFQIK